MSSNSQNSDSSEGLKLVSNISGLEIAESSVSQDKTTNSTSESVDSSNFDATDDLKQPSSNITNILNLGQEIPEDIQANKLNEGKTAKNYHSKCALAGKCKHKQNALKKKNSHAKKRHCRGSKKERDVTRKNPDLVGDDNIVSADCSFEITDEHNLTEELGYDMYEPVHDAFYDKFTKVELIERWIETEDQIESIDKHLNTVRERKRLLGLSGVDVDSEIAKIQVFKEEINKLIEENNELFQTNEKLKSYLNSTEEQEAYVRQ